MFLVLATVSMHSCDKSFFIIILHNRELACNYTFVKILCRFLFWLSHWMDTEYPVMHVVPYFLLEAASDKFVG